jgi:hypothetical protein
MQPQTGEDHIGDGSGVPFARLGRYRAVFFFMGGTRWQWLSEFGSEGWLTISSGEVPHDVYRALVGAGKAKGWRD